MEKLQDVLRSRDYNIATEKMKSRIAGAPAPSLTPAQAKALGDAELHYRIASVEPGRPRADVRSWDNMPISPGLPEKSNEPRGTSWAIAIGREPDGFIRRSLAQETLTAILSRNHPASRAYFNPEDPAHQVTVDNVFSIREILNAKE